MGVLGTTKDIINTIITFVSLVIVPISGVEYIKSLGIQIVHFQNNVIIILGVVVTIFTFLSAVTKKEVAALMTLFKAFSSAYYSYRVLNMFTYFVLSSDVMAGELIIDWGLWLYLVIGITIVTGFLSALGKLAEEEKKPKKKEEEEEEEELE